VKEDDKPLSQFFLEEELLYAGEDKEIKELLDEWKKNKKFPSKYNDTIVKGLNIVCLYDMHFFTNKMRFPPCTGFDVNISSEPEKKSEKKEDKKKK